MKPIILARTAGAFYLLELVLGSAAAFFSRNAALGDAVLVAAAACYIVVSVLLYLLFLPVSKPVSLLALCVSLAGSGYGVMATYGFDPLHVNSLVFFGVYCVLLGYLIYRSGLLPRWLGVVMVIAGAGWLSFASPAVADRLAPYNFAPGVLGETLLTLWLLVKGVAPQSTRPA